jgi:hypothetical protein
VSYPPGRDTPASDLPPDRSLTRNIRYALTSQVFPDEDENHLQLWLWDVGENPRLVYTDEMIYYDAYDDEAKLLLVNMIVWIFSQIPKDEENPAIVAADDQSGGAGESRKQPPDQGDGTDGTDGKTGEGDQQKEPPPAFRGIYFDLAGQYYYLPRNNGFSYTTSGSSFGARGGVGILFRLGPGYFGLGPEFGYNRVTVTEDENTSKVIGLNSVVLKADYTLPVGYDLSLRAGLLGGYLINTDMLMDKIMDFMCGARMYLHWSFLRNMSLYLAGGIVGGMDFLPEKDGLVFLPTVELGLRIILPPEE